MLPIPQTWHEWGQMFTDTALWRPVVERICRESGLGVVTEVRAGYPGTCAVFVVDGRVVVKIFPPTLQRDFWREREVNRLLDGRLGGVVPAVVADGVFQDRIEWPYLIFEFRPGRAIREVRGVVPAENWVALAAAFGELMRAVHDMPLVGLQHFDGRREGWEGFVRERKRAAVAEVRQKAGLGEEVLAEIAALFDQGVPVLAADFRPCLVHGDLTEDHLLLVEEGGRWRIAALIDWGDAEVGAAAYEWPALWFDAWRQEEGLLRAFWRGYEPALVVDESLAREAMVYTLLHRFGADMVRIGWERRMGERPVGSLGELQRVLWPFGDG